MTPVRAHHGVLSPLISEVICSRLSLSETDFHRMTLPRRTRSGADGTKQMQSSGLGEDPSQKGGAVLYGSPESEKLGGSVPYGSSSWGSSLRSDPRSRTAPDPKSWTPLPILGPGPLRALSIPRHGEMQQCAAQGPLLEPTGHPEPRISLRFVPLRLVVPCGCRSVGWRKGGRAEGRSQLAAAAGRHGCGKAEPAGAGGGGGGGVAI